MSRIPDGKDKQNKPVTARDWLGLTDVPDWAKARWVGAGVTVAVCLLGAWVLLIAIGAMGAMTAAVFGGEVSDLRGISIFVTAVFGAPFLVWRTVVGQKTLDSQLDANITDRISKAIEQLGSENDAVRMGGVLALERLLRDAPKDKERIRVTLNAFLEYRNATLKTGSTATIDMEAALSVLVKDDGEL